MTTARIKVYARDGTHTQCRALLDTGSTTNFITDDLVNRLRLQKRYCAVPVRALNSLHTTCNYYTTAKIQSNHTNLTKTLNFFIIRSISAFVPNNTIDREFIAIPPNIKLADPDFNKAAPIQILIGSGPSLSLLSIGQIKLPSATNLDLILQKTQLGWVIGGSVPSNNKKLLQTHHTFNLQFELEKFWKIEEGISKPHLTAEEQAAENHFRLNTTRATDGRYVVAFPFRDTVNNLGDSQKAALKRFLSLETRLNSDPALKEQYNAIIQEYINLDT